MEENELLEPADLVRLLRKNRAKARTVEKSQRLSLSDYQNLGDLLRESSERLDRELDRKRAELQSARSGSAESVKRPSPVAPVVPPAPPAGIVGPKRVITVKR